MTITTTSTKAVAQGNAATTVWPFTFLIPALTDVVVTLVLISSGDETVLAPSTYTVSGLGDPAGGTVTYPISGTPLSALYKIVVERFVPELQNTDLINQGGAYPADIEDALDYLTMIAQQLQDQINRAVVFSVADSSAGTLPLATARASKFFAFDSAGDPSVVDTITGGTVVSAAMIPVVEAATLAAARSLFGVREELTTTQVYYVRSDGSDSNNGLANTAGGAFLTLQKAWNTVANTLDTQGNVVTVNCTGTFLAGAICDGAVVGNGRVDFVSARVNILSAAAASIDTTIGGTVGFQASGGAYIRVEGFDIKTPATYGLWSIDGGSKIEHFFNTFSGTLIDQYATRGGRIEMQGDTGLNGNSQNHVQSSHQGNWRRTAGTIVALKNVTYSVAFLYAEGSTDLTITGTYVPAVFNANGFIITGVAYIITPSANIQYYGGLASDILGASAGVVFPTGYLYTGAFATDVQYNIDSNGITYAPTVLAAAGAGLTLGTVIAKYYIEGYIMRGRVEIPVTGLGTSSGQITCTLPFTVKYKVQVAAMNFTDGTQLFAYVTADGGNIIAIRTPAGAFPLVAVPKTIVLDFYTELNH